MDEPLFKMLIFYAYPTHEYEETIFLCSLIQKNQTLANDPYCWCVYNKATNSKYYYMKHEFAVKGFIDACREKTIIDQHNDTPF